MALLYVIHILIISKIYSLCDLGYKIETLCGKLDKAIFCMFVHNILPGFYVESYYVIYEWELKVVWFRYFIYQNKAVHIVDIIMLSCVSILFIERFRNVVWTIYIYMVVNVTWGNVFSHGNAAQVEKQRTLCKRDYFLPHL